jgi:hypothetical protein
MAAKITEINTTVSTAGRAAERREVATQEWL